MSSRIGEAAAEQTHLALITLAPGGRVVQANARAESLLRRQDLLRLRLGVLHACHADAQAALDVALRAVARDGVAQHLSVASPAGDAQAQLTLMRAPASRHPGE